MERSTDSKASRGFGPAVRRLVDLLDSRPPDLTVPRDLVPHGASLTWPDAGPFDAILVERMPESLGAPEVWIQEAADRLRPGGRLVLSAENLGCLRGVRRALEGRPGALDPHGVPGSRELLLDEARLLRICTASRLVARDILNARVWNERTGGDFARALMGQGILAARFVSGQPGSRLWLVADKVDSPLCSALIAQTDETNEIDLQRTTAVLGEVCPGIEIVVGESEGADFDSWNRAVPRSTGRWLWFLRAGDVPAPGDFARLAGRVELGPAVPVRAEGDVAGDLGGMLIQRETLLQVGPIPREWRSEQVAGEDWFLRAELCAWRAEYVVCGFRGRMARPGPVAAEAPRLMTRYEVMREKPAASVAAETGPEARQAPWAGRRPRVTLCMIAKNEERFLPECLERAHRAVDEIVVVDTGSTDRTVEIARSFGARVVSQPWVDDFAAPRNAGLEQATGDWILVLDADEFLEDGAVEAIRAAVEDPDVSGYYFTFVNENERVRSSGVLMVRLFRKLPGILYQNRIHEQVVPSLMERAEPLGLRLQNLAITVRHLGYSDAVVAERGKNDRNMRLFRMQLTDHPDDVYTLYKFGDFLRRCDGHEPEMLQTFERCWQLLLERGSWELCNFPYAAEVGAILGLELARRGRDQEARQIVETALSAFIPTPNLHYVAGEFAMKQGRHDVAVEHYRRCLAFRGQALVVPVTEGLTSYVGITGIAAACLLRGERDRAEVLLRGVLADRPGHEAAALHLSVLLTGQGNLTGALEPLMTCLKHRPDAPAVRFQGSVLLLRLNMPAFAAKWAEAALQSGRVPVVEANRVLAEARLLTGDLPGARQAWTQAAERGDDIGRIGVCFLDRVEGERQDVPQDLPKERVEQLFRAWTAKMESAGVPRERELQAAAEEPGR